jgi:pyruvate carboxylase
LLGDIPKVTPSSKVLSENLEFIGLLLTFSYQVVGDLAQFLVSNRLDRHTVVEQASHLSFPSSVVDFFLGNLGIPPNGFPEPLASRIRKGKEPVHGRPGASLAPVNLDEVKEMLTKKYGRTFRTCDALSYVLYPKVFEDFLADFEKYGNVSIIPTRYFLRPLEPDRELELKMSHGRSAFVTLVAQSEGGHGKREVYFTVNGNTQIVEVQDENSKAKLERPKADKGTVGNVGAPMAGSVVDVRVHPRQFVHEHDPLLVLSAMKMETVVTAPCAGFVAKVTVQNGDSVGMDDLLVLIEPAPEPTIVPAEGREVTAKEKSFATSPFQVPP